MRSNKRAGCVLWLLLQFSVSASAMDYQTKGAQEISRIFDAIATAGRFNIAVEPSITNAVSYNIQGIEPEQAMKDLATAHHFHVHLVPYVQIPTYLISTRATLPLPPPGEADPAIHTFATDGAVDPASVVQMIARTGKLDARFSATPQPKMTFNVRCTSVQALHLLAALLSMDVWSTNGVGGKSYALVPAGGSVPASPALPPTSAESVVAPAPSARTVASAPAAGPSPRAGVTPIPPVDIKVLAIAGEPPNYTVVISYEGHTYIMQRGTKCPSEDRPDFAVLEVTPRTVEILDYHSQRRVLKVFKQ